MTAVAPGAATRRTPASPVASLRLVALFLVMVLPLALLALWFGRFGTRLAMWWPAAGVAVIAVALAPRRLRLAVALGAAVLGGLANVAYGRDVDVSVVLGLATGAEAWVAARIITRGEDTWPRLFGLDDVLRFLLGALAGAAVAGVFVCVGLALEGSSTAVHVTWRTVVASHLAAVLAITPLGLRAPRPRERIGAAESALQWLTLVGLLCLIFSPDQTHPLMFLVFVPLIWGAMRQSAHTVAWQVFLTALLITGFTTLGWGPFAAAISDSPQVAAALSQASVAATALVAMPLAVLKSQRAVALESASTTTALLDSVLAAATATGVIGTDLDGRIEFFSNGAEHLTGWRAEDVVGRAALGIIGPLDDLDDDERAEVTIVETEPDVVALEILVEPLLAADGLAVRQDFWMERRDGARRIISATISRRLADGRPAGYVGIVEDVTEQRQAESLAVAALEAERQLVERLAQVDRTKNDFMSTVSHELRTPITSILGYSQLLLSDETGALPVMHRQIVGRVERNGRRLLGLIEDMLTMSQVEVGDFRYTFEAVDVREIVLRAVETELSVFGTLGVQLTQDIEGEAVLVDADPDKLERAIAALLDNAAKYSSPGDRVELTVTARDAGVTIAVADHGIGISESDQVHLFDRFFRGSDAQARAIQGAGLGLSVTSMIVDGHGGSITCTSELGEGSTFTVWLPLAEAAGAGEESAADDDLVSDSGLA